MTSYWATTGLVTTPPTTRKGYKMVYLVVDMEQVVTLTAQDCEEWWV